jgi:two-component system, chemotaxis family, chemotaxis protein CheY
MGQWAKAAFHARALLQFGGTGPMAKTILVVDDSLSFRQVVAMTLRSAGYEVLEAIHGKQGMEFLDGRKIHLILSDVNMPEMDGVTFATEVKAMPAYKFTPILMLTTEGGSDTKERGKAAGVRAWIVKPFQPTALLDAVSKLVLP